MSAAPGSETGDFVGEVAEILGITGHTEQPVRAWLRLDLLVIRGRQRPGFEVPKVRALSAARILDNFALLRSS